jgi:TolB-like protein
MKTVSYAILTLLFFIFFSQSIFSEDKAKKETWIIAVFDFKNNTEHKELGRQVAEITRVLIPDFRKFQVIDRGILRSILERKKQDIDRTLDSGAAITAAKDAKSDYFIIGSIGRLAKTFSLNMKLIDTKNGQVLKAGGLEFENMLDLRKIIHSLLEKF